MEFNHYATLLLPRTTTGEILRYEQLGLGSQFERRSVGSRSSIEDSFLVHPIIVYFAVYRENHTLRCRLIQLIFHFIQRRISPTPLRQCTLAT